MEKDKAGIFQVNCPGCNMVLWIDPDTREVIKSERPAKKKGSLDDLLLKEKKKKDETDQRFTSTAELVEKKRKVAQDKFAQVFDKLKDD